MGKEYKCRYRVGDIVKLYIDFQNENQYEGIAKIEEIISEDLPFIIDSSSPDNFRVYSSIKCKVKWIKSEYHKENDISIRRIRFLKRIGYKTYDDSDEINEECIY